MEISGQINPGILLQYFVMYCFIEDFIFGYILCLLQYLYLVFLFAYADTGSSPQEIFKLFWKFPEVIFF